MRFPWIWQAVAFFHDSSGFRRTALGHPFRSSSLNSVTYRIIQ